MTAFGMQRLEFRLHDFTRSLWVSGAAKEVWLPRIRRIGHCLQDIAWRAVVAGIQPCTIQLISPNHYSDWTSRMAEHHLETLILDKISARASSYTTVRTEVSQDEPFNYRVAIGSAADSARLKRAWEADDQSELRILQGYPTCCRDFFMEVWMKEHFLDTTWPMAFNTGAKKERALREYEVEGAAQCNILLRWLGVRAVPHLPCRFDCQATVERADQLLCLGREVGYTTEINWLQEMLDWPVEWSALHGIAEIKTPVVKIAALTDATANKYTVRRGGKTYPSEGARGLQFPYLQPPRLRLTSSRSFQMGLANPIEHSGEDQHRA